MISMINIKFELHNINLLLFIQLINQPLKGEVRDRVKKLTLIDGQKNMNCTRWIIICHEVDTVAANDAIAPHA